MDFLRRLRAEKHNGPLIIMTARDRLTNPIKELSAKADDFLVKPFDLSELAALTGLVSHHYSGNQNPRVTMGDCSVDVLARSIVVSLPASGLVQREWVVFEILLRNPGAPPTKSRIEEQLYWFEAETESNIIDVYISRLPRKRGRDTTGPARARLSFMPPVTLSSGLG